MRPVLLYTLARLGLFLVTAAVLFLVGARGALLLLLSLLISGVISFVLLSSRRDEMSAAVENGLNERRGRLKVAREKEDV
ncbi:DUF4229 domain-containing protein [Actinomadura flavalba]|uniref:DUF4229 domain-containing protein n=1 Tax=Actinomadura flavalba TaxID=1120938 RepID=UPI00035EFA1D|nr:DUF4229 domain-containing protein [Actinomadura flavalba]